MTVLVRLLLVFLAAEVLLAQPAPGLDQLRNGVFLVAARSLRDPNFAQSVVLLNRYDRTGAMGLIVNRRLDLPLSRLFPSLPSGSGSISPYEGGPVQRGGALALLRSRTKPETDSEQVVGDVYLVSSRSVLEKALAAGPTEASVRVYLGYAGWGPRQLEGEVAQGGWHVFAATANLVFDDEPEALWKRLIRRTEMNIAGLTQRSLSQRTASAPLAVRGRPTPDRD